MRTIKARTILPVFRLYRNSQRDRVSKISGG